jgi:ABC-type Fe3+/spermidine/putrescine transport system ATPase subunit
MSPRGCAEFVGTGNILPAVVEEVEHETLWLRWQGQRIAVAPAPLAPGTPVYLCVRPTQVFVVRPDRLTERQRENLLCGQIVGELLQGETYTLHLRLDQSTAAYDLEIALPGYVYHRLSLDSEKQIMIELRRQALHVIPRDGNP